MPTCRSAGARFRFNQGSPPFTGSGPKKYTAKAATTIGGGASHNIAEFCHIQLYNQRHLISTEGIHAQSVALKARLSPSGISPSRTILLNIFRKAFITCLIPLNRPNNDGGSSLSGDTISSRQDCLRKIHANWILLSKLQESSKEIKD